MYKYIEELLNSITHLIIYNFLKQQINKLPDSIEDIAIVNFKQSNYINEKYA